jgi:MinD-like ATPase involved in chromosome partitioning or flagellar assembly
LVGPGENAVQAAWTVSGGAYQPQAVHAPTEVDPVGLDSVPAPANFGNNTLGQVVAVTSSKGGSGKSTMSLSLATYIAHASIAAVKEGLEARPLKVVVLDLDVRDSQVGFFTGPYRPTVLNLRKNGISPETIADTAIYHDGLKLDVILGPRKPRAAEDLPPEFYVDLIQTLRGLYDYVILDTSVQYTDPLLEKVAYPIADQIIMVTEVAIPSVHSMFRWIKEVTNPPEQNGMGIPKQKIAIIVNKSLGQVHLSGKEIVENAQGIPILTAIPSNQRLIVLATNLSAIQAVLRDNSIKEAVGRAVKAIVGDKYQLSDNLEIDA